MLLINAAFEEGSSPLTRGKRGPRKPFRHGRGLIPAHAGKTSPALPSFYGFRAHPRSRGENRAFGCIDEAAKGSSPLTRGKRPPHFLPSTGSGLIPAHAGKTRQWRARSPCRWAHPRSRGENAAYVGDVPNDAGSSPLTRGKLRLGVGLLRGGRLIPAHAGKTSTGSRSPSPPGAHPRSRGENRRRVGRRVGVGGSSPLTRGKLSARGWRRSARRLIPAHAGKTCGGCPR